MPGHEVAKVERARWLGIAERAELEELGLPVPLLRWARKALHRNAVGGRNSFEYMPCRVGIPMPRIHCALGVSELLEMLLRLQAHRRGIAADCGNGTAYCARYRCF
jgi:hypothetical protein